MDGRAGGDGWGACHAKKQMLHVHSPTWYSYTMLTAAVQVGGFFPLLSQIFSIFLLLLFIFDVCVVCDRYNTTEVLPHLVFFFLLWWW